MATEISASAEEQRRFTGKQVFLIVAGVVLVTIVATFWIVKTWLFPSEFRPTVLNQKEEQVLEEKIDRLGGRATSAQPGLDPDNRATPALTPEPYSENAARREVRFSEKELNALLAKNTNLASRLAIDLSDNLASAKLLIPLDEDFPVMGGKTVKVSGGLELAYSAGRPMVILKGISIMGVPVPSAWMGNLKNVDLVRQFGSDRGFWKAFADGVELIEVKDGALLVKLKE